jgi:Bacterial translation initiation factor IF-2 associated region.
MTETKNPGEKLTVAPSKPLTLKRSVEQGVVRQSFSHGRTKAVVVEKVKRRIGPGEGKIEAPPGSGCPASGSGAVARRRCPSTETRRRPPQGIGRGAAHVDRRGARSARARAR